MDLRVPNQEFESGSMLPLIRAAKFNDHEQGLGFAQILPYNNASTISELQRESIALPMDEGSLPNYDHGLLAARQAEQHLNNRTKANSMLANSTPSKSAEGMQEQEPKINDKDEISSLSKEDQAFIFMNMTLPPAFNLGERQRISAPTSDYDTPDSTTRVSMANLDVGISESSYESIVDTDRSDLSSNEDHMELNRNSNSISPNNLNLPDSKINSKKVKHHSKQQTNSQSTHINREKPRQFGKDLGAWVNPELQTENYASGQPHPILTREHQHLTRSHEMDDIHSLFKQAVTDNENQAQPMPSVSDSKAMTDRKDSAEPSALPAQVNQEREKNAYKFGLKPKRLFIKQMNQFNKEPVPKAPRLSAQVPKTKILTEITLPPVAQANPDLAALNVGQVQGSKPLTEIVHGFNNFQLNVQQEPSEINSKQAEEQNRPMNTDNLGTESARPAPGQANLTSYDLMTRNVLQAKKNQSKLNSLSANQTSIQEKTSLKPDSKGLDDLEPGNLGLSNVIGSKPVTILNSPSAPSNLNISQREQDTTWRQNLGHKINDLAIRNLHEANFSLNHEGLGPIDVRIKLDKNKLNVSFNAKQPKIRDLIESQLPILQQNLLSSGLELQAEVNQQFSQQAFEQNSNAKQGPDSGNSTAKLESSNESSNTKPSSKGLIDLLA